MFRHQDENDHTNQAAEPQADATLGAAAPAGATTPNATSAVEASEVDEALKALSAHASPDEPAAPVLSAPAATAEETAPAADGAVVDEDRGAAPAISEADASALLGIKQSALEQLTPLIDQLDQTPEERFRTTMMMIQAADNQALLQTAYQAAQNIGDEKVKAQALLDVVNEINYFTQPTEA